MVRDLRDPGTKEIPSLATTRGSRSAPAAGLQFIGYARVSTYEQNLNGQLDDLSAAGAAVIYTESASGKSKDRPELKNALRALRAGDTLLVWRTDRLGRNLVHLVQIVNELDERGIGVRSLMEPEFNTTTASGTFVFRLFALLAQRTATHQ